MVVGPRVDSLPACIECLALLYPSLTRCPTCGVSPLCTRCSHFPLECQFYSSLTEEKKDICLQAGNQYILPLKIILHLKSPNGDGIFNKILEMESHLETRRGTFVWQCNEKNVVEVINSTVITVSHLDVIFAVNEFEVNICLLTFKHK